MDDGKTIQSPGRRKLLKRIGLTGAGGIAGLAIVNGVAPFVVAEDTVFDDNHSYWSLALPLPRPPLQRDIDVDVAIVGGGFTGLSTAYYMSKTLPGKRIAVIEAKGCGNGALTVASTADELREAQADFSALCEPASRVRADIPLVSRCDVRTHLERVCRRVARSKSDGGPNGTAQQHFLWDRLFGGGRELDLGVRPRDRGPCRWTARTMGMVAVSQSSSAVHSQ